jgi:7-cyano-7-deazaguanine reductase
MSTTNLNDIASKSLGSSASYAVYTDRHDASLLNPMPRKLAREGWGIKGDEFVGYDTWHCHESTFLLNNGAPVAGTLKYTYSSDSKYMVESKSAKLYLNTFDMCKMGQSIDTAIENYELQVKADLEKALETEVDVKFFKSGEDDLGIFPMEGYLDLQTFLGKEIETLEIDDYTAEKNHLQFEKVNYSGFGYSVKEGKALYKNKFFTNALRSRCRHTKQKDTGAAYIWINTLDSVLKPESLFKQIISLREVNEFHEFCAEKLYTEIMKCPEVESCCVTLLYARRGSLDINPTRATSYDMLPPVLINPKYYTKKAMGQ